MRPIGSVAGAPRGYLEYLPPDDAAGGAPPLLVFLHGGGSGGDSSEQMLESVKDLGIPQLIAADRWPDDRPFVVLAPQMTTAETDQCQAGEMVDEFLSWAVDHYEVDPERVYLTGLSCGSIAAWDYIADHEDEVISAAVHIAGHFEDSWAEQGCDLGRVPLWIIHGEQDEVVPFSIVSDRVAEMRDCDPPPVELRFDSYPDADHDSWSRTYDLSAGLDVYSWLLEH